ncbi:MAG TPA: hypothetical protein VEX38_10580, partial [Fimbriimonadaceae bacterium]|nr:hypothetical protein [Fimbriimonadaceae bacterium]
MNLDGEWHGHYAHDKPMLGAELCQFTATLRSTDTGFTGSIVEHRELVARIPYAELIEEQRPTMSASELREAEALLKSYDNITFLSELPLTAEVNGRVSGSTVRF